jgi:hypothetical protein
VMRTPPKVLVLERVLRTIEREIRPYRNSNTETGGILIGGYIDPEAVLIIGASGPGPLAEHHDAEYALDVGYAQDILNEYTTRYPNVDYVGEWHRHPGTFDRPSGGDWETAARILQDPSYRVDALINPIVILPGGEFRISFYYIHRDYIARGQNFTRIAIEPAREDDPRVQAFLNQEQNIRVDERTARGPTTQAWFETPDGRRRLADENEALKRRYEVSRAQPLENGFVFHVSSPRSPGQSVYLICPESYPTSRPRVLVEAAGKEEEPNLRSLANWSSAHLLVDLVDEALATKGPTFPKKSWLAAAAMLVSAVLSLIVFAMFPRPVTSKPVASCAKAVELLAKQDANSPTSHSQLGVHVIPLDARQLEECQTNKTLLDNGDTKRASVFVLGPLGTPPVQVDRMHIVMSKNKGTSHFTSALIDVNEPLPRPGTKVRINQCWPPGEPCEAEIPTYTTEIVGLLIYIAGDAKGGRQ